MRVRSPEKLRPVLRVHIAYPPALSTIRYYFEREPRNYFADHTPTKQCCFAFAEFSMQFEKVGIRFVPFLITGSSAAVSPSKPFRSLARRKIKTGWPGWPARFHLVVDTIIL
jgi:hypothetical protein